MPSETSSSDGILNVRMLFEHTQRQYARVCSRIIRQDQFQQDGEKKETNGVQWVKVAAILELVLVQRMYILSPSYIESFKGFSLS